MANTLRFDDPNSGDSSVVGGKGANLGLLTQAGFAVPPGFSITVQAYSDFLSNGNLQEKLLSIAAEIDYDDPEQLEALTSSVRELIVTAEFPLTLGAEIAEGYKELGEPEVAVRSSGTAEDSAEASFAGLHDTHLSIKGADALLEAVKLCWASMWTARATSYRQAKGFDHATAQMAVVVQAMVDAEVAGVMFTGNPMTAASDEFVINASWGLGEGVVSGTVTPDQYIVAAPNLRVRERTVGTKALRIVRNPATESGTVAEEVPAGEQAQFTLNDAQLSELSELGRRVTALYHGFPQDIEWALAGGNFYLLQSRPITGVDFSWDSDIDGWHRWPEDDDCIWTRAFADDIWTGAITPLMYSFRAGGFENGNTYNQALWGFPEAGQVRAFKYYRGEAYYNSAIDKWNATRIVLPQVRAGFLANVPPTWHGDVLDAPFSYAGFLKLMARIHGLDGNIHGVRAWLKNLDDYMYNRIEEAEALSNEELRLLSDDELKKFTLRAIDYEHKYMQDVWTGFFVHAANIMSMLGWAVAKWYDGPNRLAFTDLITGVPKRTVTMEENNTLWRLANRIRESKVLTKAVEKYEDAEFFAELNNSEEGRDFLAAYQPFLEQNAHRGHADRDIYYARRSEDPGIDYRALRAYLSADASLNPEEKEEVVNRRREASTEEIIANIQRKPLGSLKAELFKSLLHYTQSFLMARDNERHFVDRTTFTIKRAFLEINRRITERGLFESERDFYFLAKEELFDVLDGRANMTLVRAKIAARMHNFDRLDRKEVVPPMYLHRGRPLEFETATDADSTTGLLQGLPTSRGVVTGTARIVRELKHIGSVQGGDILITNSTDPGWTPIFLVVKGLVLETGGMLSHGSCLAREYGFPAVQLANAMTRIPDGATITINGDTGQVTVDDPA